MVKKTYTVQLDGTVSLDRLTGALSAWESALHAIAENVGKAHVISMTVEDLVVGSAIVEVSIEFDADTWADNFESGYEQYGRQIRDGNVIDFPSNLKRPVTEIRKAAFLDGPNSLVLLSDRTEIMVDPVISHASLRMTATSPPYFEAMGTVIGKLQSLTSRKALKATVYDSINDRAVRCVLSESDHEKARDLWDTEVVVEGVIRRDPRSGRPISIRKIRNIGPQDKSIDRYAWMRARGALRHIHPEKTSEELIRLARNG